MFEIIEDNKHLILLIIVAILLLSTIFAGKSKTNEDKLNVLNKSIKILQNAKKRVNKSSNYIPEYKSSNYIPEDNYGPTNFEEQYYNQPPSDYYENNIEPTDILTNEPEMYVNEKSTPEVEISKESIENLIKDIRPTKKVIKQQNSLGMDKFFQKSNILESDGNFNRIMELVKFKMNPTTNMRPDLAEQISSIGTGCNKDNEFEIDGFDNIILPQEI